MAYLKDKNIVKFVGKSYSIEYNISDGTVTTNHPEGYAYVKRTTKKGDSLGRLVGLATQYACNDSKLNPFIETILAQAPRLFEVLTRSTCYWSGNVTLINNAIEMAQNDWKIIRELETENKIYDSYDDFIDSFTAKKFDLNETEKKWFSILNNVDFVKRFAGQLEMYSEFLTIFKIKDTLEECIKMQMDITPYLKNKNLLQTICEIERDKEFIKNTWIVDGLENSYQKYKHLETTDADGWKYHLLRTRDDFKAEAERMHNCLVHCGYDKKTANGWCIIIVAETPDGERIDIELNPIKRKIIQAFERNNHYISSNYRDHLNRWADGLTI